ncbi:hypothetical protein HYY74_02580 [Candidatus Woesearchaeota archaeon]|nr:hypothetical protein [Candidatus Woesearchaeota archaeon]
MDRKKTFAIVAVAVLLITAALGATALAHQSNRTIAWQGMMSGQKGQGTGMMETKGGHMGTGGQMDIEEMKTMHRQMHGEEMPEHCQQMMG